LTGFLFGRTGILENIYLMLSGKQFMMLNIQDEPFEMKLMQEIKDRNIKYLWDCFDGPKVIFNQDPSIVKANEDYKGVHSVINLAHLPSQLLFKSSYLGTHGFECRKFEVRPISKDI
jgi:hypothetical protein